MIRRPAALAFLRENGAMMLIEVLVNFVLPYAVYVATQHAFGDVRALMASSVPPVLWSIAEFVRKRRMDALSLLVLAGIALSLLAFLGGGSARFLQLRENFVTVFIGLVFLGSALAGKPLIYQLARATMRRKSRAELESFEALRDKAPFRRTMMIMTLVWGFGLLAAAAASCALLFVVSIATYLLISRSSRMLLWAHLGSGRFGMEIGSAGRARSFAPRRKVLGRPMRVGVACVARALSLNALAARAKREPR